ncbi:MAG: YifB family Mg chelatase-like AAA ATPase [Elusimicrobiota bacterium]|nr:YifB family Mg chelatase-like AAA ATPase [Elusimicrobiota bacterium]
MSLARVHSAGLRGVDGVPVLVELDLAKGLPSYATVGLPDGAVKESRERVAAAVRNSGYEWPRRRVTVNLAPARARKQGTHYDLPIALALLAASGQLVSDERTAGWCVVGELSLDGRVRPVAGALAMACRAKADGFTAIVLPEENAAEASASGLRVIPVCDLREAVELASGAPPRDRAAAPPALPPPSGADLDLADVKGQETAKRALELAAAGGHNLLLVGPPGTGKSMLARRLPGLLPPPSPEESAEVTRVLSAFGAPPEGGVARARPFRAPHHTASAQSLVGGGPSARPGEVSLAHGGVLFLDELAEFGRPALEALRQPLEDRVVRVTRARDAFDYPARFQLVAASNPCPCGWRGHPRRACECGPHETARYLSRLSGPLLDRVDLQVETTAVRFEEWSRPASAESSASVRARVAAARERQAARWGAGPGALNAFVDAPRLRKEGRFTDEALRTLGAAEAAYALSARALDRALRVARTAADLAGREAVEGGAVREALNLRALERLRAGLGEAA